MMIRERVKGREPHLNRSDGIWNHPAGSPSGFTLIEILICSFLGILILLITFKLLDGSVLAFRDQDIINEMRANGRAGLESIVRDLHMAGYEIVNKGALSFDGTLFPEDSGGLTIRSNPDGLMALLQTTLAEEDDPLTLDSVEGFNEGDTLTIFGIGDDDEKHVENFTVLEIDGSANVIHHSSEEEPHSFSTRYKSGAVLVRLTEVRYVIDTDEGGISELYREVIGEEAHPVADHIIGLSFQYYDGEDPPGELFTFETGEDRRKIRSLKITLTVEPSRCRVGGRTIANMDIVERVTPRNLISR